MLANLFPWNDFERLVVNKVTKNGKQRLKRTPLKMSLLLREIKELGQII